MVAYEPNPNDVLDRMKTSLEYSDKQRRNRASAMLLSAACAVGLEFLLGYSTNKNLNAQIEKASPELRRVYVVDKELFGLCQGMRVVDAIDEYKKNQEFTVRYNELAKERDELKKKPDFSAQVAELQSAQSNEVKKIGLYSLMVLCGFVAAQVGINKVYNARMAKAPSLQDLFEKKD